MADNTKIEWAEATWNPVTGCRHGCEYCYARRIAERFGGWSTVFGTKTTIVRNSGVLDRPMLIQRGNGKIVKAPFPFGFEPTFHRYRLDIPAKWEKPRTIFVCSMADLFGEWVPTRWIVDVLDACAAAPQHRYLFLTKNPARYGELDYLGLLPHGKNFWYGTTATQPGEPFFQRERINTFLSIEPIRGKIPSDSNLGVKWIIIGVETGNRKGKIAAHREWIESAIDAGVGHHIPVFMKDSLIPIVGAENMRREFPWDETKGETTR